MSLRTNESFKINSRMARAYRNLPSQVCVDQGRSARWQSDFGRPVRCVAVLPSFSRRRSQWAVLDSKCNAKGRHPRWLYGGMFYGDCEVRVVLHRFLPLLMAIDPIGKRLYPITGALTAGRFVVLIRYEQGRDHGLSYVIIL
jgi:hypothetical protein